MRLDETGLMLLAAAMGKPIKVLNLSERTYNSLRRWGGINTVADVVEKTMTKDGTDYKELMKVRGIGNKAMEEIKHNLDMYLSPYMRMLQND